MLKFSTTSENDKITSIAIGGFDGLHTAHKKLLAELDENGALLVIEKGFSPALTPGLERCRHISFPCFFLDFAAIRSMEAVDFLHYLRRLFPMLQKIIVGYDFRFGKDRAGDPTLLRRMEDIAVTVIEEYVTDGVSVHADKIRRLLKAGKIKEANRLLGREYAVRGTLVRGQGLGGKALYPTCNLETGDFLLPKEGVYVTRTVIGEKYYTSVTFIGKRLSADNQFSVETHILDENLDVKEKELEVFFLEYLRPIRKFETLQELKQQISDDIKKAKSYEFGDM